MPTYTPLGPGWTITSTQSESIPLAPPAGTTAPGADGTARPFRAPPNITGYRVEIVAGVLGGAAGWSGSLVVQEREAGFGAPWVPAAYARASDGTTQSGSVAISAADMIDLDASRGAEAQVVHTYTSGTLTLVVLPAVGGQ